MKEGKSIERQRFLKVEKGGLYLLTPSQVPWREDFPDLLEQALEGGMVACLQIRLKFAGGAREHEEIWHHCVELVLPMARRHGVVLLLNDRACLAGKLRVDGAHIGQEDGSVREARKFVGTGVLGVTCHDSLKLAREAEKLGADYVAFGSFFASHSKPDANPASLATLRHWRQKGGIPCVAIGGIDVVNGLGLLRAGANFLAVCHGVWEHRDGPGEAVRKFGAMFAQLQENPC